MELLMISTLTGIATMFGVIMALMFGQPGRRILAFYLGLSAGIMVLIILVDLIPAAFAEGPLEAVGIGLGIGLLSMMGISRLLHSSVGDESFSIHPNQKEYYRMGMLIALAIAFHNIPEGIAIGAGFETHHHLGTMVALSIALHNVPEGIGMCIPFIMAEVRRRWIILISLIVSLCIPLGAWLGQLFFVGSSFMVAMGLAFASGAMGYIVWKEIGPTSIKYHSLFALMGMAVSVGLIYIMHILR